MLASKIKILYYIGACLRLLTQRVVGLCRKKTCFCKKKKFPDARTSLLGRSHGGPRENPGRLFVELACVRLKHLYDNIVL